MKLCLLIVFVALLQAGCAVNRLPLAEALKGQSGGVAVEAAPDSKVELYFSTARGKNASQAGATGGIIGYVIGSSVASGAEADGLKTVKRIRQETGEFETALLLEAIQSQLAAAGHSPGPGIQAQKLLLQIQAAGLVEHQRGFWTPYLRITAKLAKGNDSSWKVLIEMSGAQTRKLDDYSNHPRLYQGDMDAIAKGIARQIVVGPILR